MRSFPNLGFDPAEGNKDAVQTLILQISVAHETIASTLPRLEEAAKLTDETHWEGNAAEEFSDHGDDLPVALGTGGESMAAVAKALTEWFETLSTNQLEADDLERQARDAKKAIRLAEADLHDAAAAIPHDTGHPQYQARYDAFLDANEKAARCDDALTAIINKAKDLKRKHEQAANRTADAIRSGPDDAFKPENDSWYVQTLDGIAVGADVASLAAGTVAAGLAAAAPMTLGGSLLPAAIAEGVSSGLGMVGSGAALFQQVAKSGNAPGWGSVALGLGLSTLPIGGTAAAAVRNGARLALKSGSKKAFKQAQKQAAKDLEKALSASGVPKLAGDVNQLRKGKLDEQIEKELKEAGEGVAKRRGLDVDDLSDKKIRELGLQAKQAEAYANLVGKGQEIAEKAGIDLTFEQRQELRALQLALNPTSGQVDKTLEGIGKKLAEGKGP